MSGIKDAWCHEFEELEYSSPSFDHLGDGVSCGRGSCLAAIAFSVLVHCRLSAAKRFLSLDGVGAYDSRLRSSSSLAYWLAAALLGCRGHFQMPRGRGPRGQDSPLKCRLTLRSSLATKS